MDKFLKIHKLSKLTQEETGQTQGEIESVITNHQRKTQDQMDSLVNSIKQFTLAALFTKAKRKKQPKCP